jgi:DNA repair protein RadA/Sms
MFSCSACEFKSEKWLAQCPHCGEYGLFSGIGPSVADALAAEETQRRARQITSEFDVFNTVIGGKMIPGQVFLLGGDPGVGKSTLLLQIIKGMRFKYDRQLVYISAEEGREQIIARIKRLDIMRNELVVYCRQSVTEVFPSLENIAPILFVIDSIQTMYVDGEPGTPKQIKAVAKTFNDYAKKSRAICIMVSHINKEGDFSSQKWVEHLVDTVVMFNREKSDEEGEETSTKRKLVIQKNRFGPEYRSVFLNMTEKGLTT